MRIKDFIANSSDQEPVKLHTNMDDIVWKMKVLCAVNTYHCGKYMTFQFIEELVVVYNVCKYIWNLRSISLVFLIGT